MVFVKLALITVLLIRLDSIPVVMELVLQDNAMETNISQELVNIVHAEECKE